MDWDGPSDPSNPFNFSLPRKWFIAILTSLGGLVTLMTSNMLAPALTSISEDLHVSETTAAMALSIFVLAYAFGPMVLAPCSEVWGRRYVWIFGAAWYILWNTVCGISKNGALMIVGRFMAGLGGSVEFAVSLRNIGSSYLIIYY